MLGEIFGFNSEEGTGCEKKNNEGIRNPYTLTHVIRGISHKLYEMDWACFPHTRDDKCVQKFSLERSSQEAVR